MKTKPSAALKQLQDELATLRSLDARNQTQSAGTGGTPRLTRAQMCLLTEAVFFAAFRAYEQFLRNVFLLYCSGIQSGKRRLVRSFLQPRSVSHAESLVKSAMPFLDWSSPDTLVERAESYLREGYPVKTPITTNMELLRELKRLRNHIAHMSGESSLEFKKLLKAHFGTVPLRIPRPGEYLLLPSRRVRTTYYLLEYLAAIERVAEWMT
jgi:hypothetical protein